MLDLLGKKGGDSVYVIAEIGQNHQGCLATAKSMILEAKKSGCDCVKFQKSDLNAKFTKSALQRPYVGEQSWGSTYGEHKAYLEFSKSEYYDLQAYCMDIGIDFTASAMDERSLEFLAELKVPFIKIGSGDANNYPLLKKAADLGIPLIISTGMQMMSTVDKIVEIMSDAGHNKYALMHCVSAYPTPPRDCNLVLIPALMSRYQNVIVGYSGHELGITISQAAVLMGARILERHFTLSKHQKGSDHRCSLEPKELQSLVYSIRQFQQSGQLRTNKKYKALEILNFLGNTNELNEALQGCNEEKQILESELPCRRKLGKSLVAARNLHRGHKLQSADLTIKVSEPCGLEAEKYFDVIGHELLANVKEDEPLTAQVLIPIL